MSSKKNLKNIGFSKIFTVMGIGLAILLSTRLYQLFALTESDATGFLKSTDFSVYLMYIAAAVFSIALLLMVTFSNKVTASKSVRGKNKALAIGSLILSAGIAYDVAISLSALIKSIMSYGAGSHIMTYLFTNGMLAVALEAVCGLAACIYFLLFSLSYFDGKTTYFEYKLLAIMPLFWSMFRMVHRFMTKISFTMVADLMIELFMLAFMMMFFMSFARVSSQLCQKGEMRKAMRYGVVSAMFALLLGVTRLVVTVGGKSELLPDGFPFSLADLTYGIFAIIYVISSSKTGRNASEDDLIDDEEEKKKIKEEIDDDFLEN